MICWLLLFLFLLLVHSTATSECATTSSAVKSPCSRPFTGGSKDMEEFRMGYIGRNDDLTKSDNLLFYQNKLGSRPDGVLVEDVLKPKSVGGWYGDYDELEANHGYIQWLFPLRSMSGSNGASQELMLHEAIAVRSDATIRSRYTTAFQLILDFYGITMVNNATGELKRSANYAERFANLQQNTHNNLRISRILKSAGEFGFEHWKFPLLKFFATEIYENGLISNSRGSLREYWSESLRNVSELIQMRAIVARYDSNYDSSLNSQVCTELSTCTTSLVEKNDCTSSSSSSSSTTCISSSINNGGFSVCCPTTSNAMPTFVQNICQCVASSVVTSTSSSSALVTIKSTTTKIPTTQTSPKATTTTDDLNHHQTPAQTSSASSTSPMLTFAIIGGVALAAVVGLAIFQLYHSKKAHNDQNKIQMI